MAQLLKLIDGSTLKMKGKEVYEAIYSGMIKQVDIEKRRMTMIGTDETKDRDGDIIALGGWRLEDYRKNPVFLWAHNYGSVPLARTEKLIKRREPAGMEFHLTFPTKGLHPFADMILELYGEKIINASSVGFIPWSWEDIQEASEDEKSIKNGKRKPCGRKYTDQELLELSGCAVPSNPNALQNALKGKSFVDMPFEDIQKWLQGKTLPPRPKMEDDVMGELLEKEVEFVDETRPKQVQVPASTDLTFSGCEIVDEMKEEKEEDKGVISYHNYGNAPEGDAWDAGAEVRVADVSDLKKMCTWFNSADAENKGAYKLPHHKQNGYKAVWRGVAAAMGACMGARGGVQIPEGDMGGCKGHLAKHYKDFDKEPPKSAEEWEQQMQEFECNSWDGKLEGLEVPPYDEKDAVKSEEVLKPYPGEHACRLEDPGKFERFARKNCFRKHDNKCVDFIFGYPKEGGGELQAMRYPKDVWDAGAARSHCSSHKGSFEAAGGASVESIDYTPMFEHMFILLDSIYNSNKELLEALKSLKPVEVDSANQPKNLDLTDGKKVKSASETILGEAFKLGKEKPNPLPSPPAQYDMSGVLRAVKDLHTQIKKIGGS